jgi:hypothetical protein
MTDEPRDILKVLYTFVQGSKQVSGVFDDWLEVAEEVSARLDYETAVAVGMQGREGQDVQRWIIGKMGAAMTEGTQHGQKRQVLNDYAKDIGVSISTLDEWVDTARFWPPPILKALREKYGDMIPPWTMFNRARRGLNLEDAVTMVELAAANAWSVSKMEAEKAKRKGKDSDDDVREIALNRCISSLKNLSGIGLSGYRYKEAQDLRRNLESDLTTLKSTGQLPR